MNLKKTRIFTLIKAEIHVEINSFVPRYFSIANCLAYIIAPCPKLRRYFNKHFMPWFFYLFFKNKFVLSFTVPQLFSPPAQLLCMGAQGESIREELTSTIWRATGTASFGVSALGYRRRVVWMWVLLHQHVQIS